MGKTDGPMSAARVLPAQIARLTLPTPVGEWQMTAFDWDGTVHLCLCRGQIVGVLAREL